MNFKYVSFLFLFFTSLSFAQNTEYNSLNISDSLKENANAVIRLNQIDILISSQRNMNVITKRVVTVLNEKGLDAIDAVENYDKRTIIKNIETTVYEYGF